MATMTSAPQCENTVCAFILSLYSDYIYVQTTFFYHGRFQKKLADNQCSPITEGGIYYMSIQPFTMIVNWPEIGSLMDISMMFDVCTYCVFTLYNRPVWLDDLYIINHTL